MTPRWFFLWWMVLLVFILVGDTAALVTLANAVYAEVYYDGEE